MTCPRCGLPDEVPPTSRRCACGFDLSACDRDLRRADPAIRLAGIGVVVLLALPMTLVIASAARNAMLPLVQALLGAAFVAVGWRRGRRKITLPTARVHRERA